MYQSIFFSRHTKVLRKINEKTKLKLNKQTI